MKTYSFEKISRTAYKFVATTLLTMFLLIGTLTIVSTNYTVAAEPACADDKIECQLRSVFEKKSKAGGPELQNFGSRFHELSSSESGADTLTSIIFIALDFVKYALGTIALVFAIVTGLKLVTAGSKAEEEYGKSKKALQYLIMGLVLVIISDELVTKVFFGEYGECLANSTNAEECARAGGTIVKGLYSFILAIMSSVAIFMIVYSGFKMGTAFESPDDIDKEKKHIIWAIGGLILAGIAEFAVKGVIFPEAGGKLFDIQNGIKLMTQLTNFTAGFIGAGSFAMLFYGGYMYVASFGSDDMTGKAKKIITGAIAGMLIALVAFGAVTTIAGLNTGRKEDTTQGGNIR